MEHSSPEFCNIVVNVTWLPCLFILCFCFCAFVSRLRALRWIVQFQSKIGLLWARKHECFQSYEFMTEKLTCQRHWNHSKSLTKWLAETLRRDKTLQSKYVCRKNINGGSFCLLFCWHFCAVYVTSLKIISISSFLLVPSSRENDENDESHK